MAQNVLQMCSLQMPLSFFTGLAVYKCGYSAIIVKVVTLQTA